MNIKNMYITKNRPYQKRSKTTKIAVHYIGNPGTSAEANRNYFNNNDNDVSSNYIIGLNGEIICCIPDEEVAWCTCQANSYSISIENCHPDSTGKFNDKTYKSLVELCAYLCKKYRLTENDLIRHYDVTGKVCPKSFVPKSKGGSDDNNNSAWKKFKSDVRAKLTPSVLDKSGYKKNDKTIGSLALKELLLTAKAKGIIRSGMDENRVVGNGTINAINECLKKWGYKQTGIAGENFIKKLAQEIRKK